FSVVPARTLAPRPRVASGASTRRLAKAGWHGFSGSGWGDMPVGRFNGPAVEISASHRLVEGPLGLDVGGNVGYFRGETSDHMTGDGGDVSFTTGFSAFYGDADLRAVVQS